MVSSRTTKEMQNHERSHVAVVQDSVSWQKQGKAMALPPTDRECFPHNFSHNVGNAPVAQPQIDNECCKFA